MRNYGILIALAASLLLAGSIYTAKADDLSVTPAKKASIQLPVKTASDVTSQSGAQLPTLEQVEQQMQSLFIEAGARIERIRAAQVELEQINKNLQQLTQLKAQLTGKSPTAPANTKSEGK